MDLSVIVPLHNEQDNVLPLHQALDQALSPLGLDYEILLVDDGSRDETVARATELTRHDTRLRLVRLRRNYGQTSAMTAGMAIARGRILITMDGDLQNDPADIPLFLDKIAEGYDLVVGWRHRRQDKLLSRKLPSVIANWLIGRVTGVPIRDNGCSLKAYRAEVIRQVPLYSEMHRFIPAMASTVGCRIAEIRVRHHARRFGESKYGLSRVYKVLLDMLVVKTLIAFANRPLAWFSLLGLPIAIVGVSTVMAAILVRPLGEPMSMPFAATGMTLMALAVFLFGSGAVAELLVRTGRPGGVERALITAEIDKSGVVDKDKAMTSGESA
ncbi:glycosyltransferase involved in cell wall biosynthesis [Natronocella acetinitrilica]|uniref:Glycosyltransferase involved in cell wall biosynthesis n=1 Tax=Natronocella acetinitrilica TaxID=414046 RepID=A0AAE3KCG2_9GAMM|nr:glycosyltransferase family 2 protein [Natronocella acetinitrilica]MCP1675784.1 glycosyltransferase involved in cell wall biosynthesis [Natronocella acetinitrilica]